MTMYSKKSVMKNLRKEKEKLGDMIIAVKLELMRLTPILSSLGKTYDISDSTFPHLVKNLWKAIDEEDPRTAQCKNCSEVCRAYINLDGKCPPKEAEG